MTAHEARHPLMNRLLRRWLTLGGLALAGCMTHADDAAPIGPCGFDLAALTFAGDALTQARCLLRPVTRGGLLSQQPAALPATLANLIGQPVGELRPRLRAYLARRHIGDAAIGGSVDAPLSHARDDDPAAPAARYFVLHDTSTPWLGDAPGFPASDDAGLNDLVRFAGPDAAAHMFVARDGQVLLGHDYRTPWRATQFESRRIGVAARGLFLHNEFAQPRRRDPAGSAHNDLIAPSPGFTHAQYVQMALLYAAASARRGDWLIPAFHAAIDEGMAGAHDDPQNFEIERFALALDDLRRQIAH